MYPAHCELESIHMVIIFSKPVKVRMQANLTCIGASWLDKHQLRWLDKVIPWQNHPWLTSKLSRNGGQVSSTISKQCGDAAADTLVECLAG